MKALVCRDKKLAIETIPDPEPGPGQLILRVESCGICGTDLSLQKAGVLADGTVMGHEFAGEVLESGHGFKAGERVCALPMLSCGRCNRCKSGLGAFCQKVLLMGVGPAQGAFAELVPIAAHETVRLPAQLRPQDGALVEPMAVALHAARTARVRPGEGVVVLGAGPIGLAAVVWARHFGASQVLVSDRVPERREMAERLGATGTAEPGPALDDLLATRIPEGADVVIEAVGAPGLIQQALAAMRFRGRVVVAGVCMGPDTIQPFPAITKEASVHFVLAYEKDDFQYTIDMLEAGRISPQPMVTSQVALEDVPGAFETLATPCEQCKVLFVAGDIT